MSVSSTIHLSNPFQEFIAQSDDDPRLIQERYETHRSTRTAEHRTKILDPRFPGWRVDDILAKLQCPDQAEPGFLDPRNNLAFWARPPRHIRDMVRDIQQEIQSVAPSLWFTPAEGLHMTTLEITNSLTEDKISAIVASIPRDAIESIVNHTLAHRTRLIKPQISYDASAMALCFVPAAGEGRTFVADRYTYHHLRRDLYDQVTATGVMIAARYTVPSAHVTIARFINQHGFVEEAAGGISGVAAHRVQELVCKIEEINRRLVNMYWPKEDGTTPVEGEWLVGQGMGLEFCQGRSWYGQGDRICIGEGF